ncbi:MAG TPA: hypothetical protein VGJ05_19875 [Fimbriiglobus sp.]|jgi:tetratricopeptide (TPR) repeat protein
MLSSRYLAVVIAGFSLPLTGVAQTLKSAPVMLHPDDLLVGPAEAEVEFVKDGKEMKKDVQIQLLTKSYVVYNEYSVKNGQKVLSDIQQKHVGGPLSQRCVPVIMSRNTVWTWNPKLNQYAGAIVPPAIPTVSRGEVNKQQLKLYLTLRAEHVHLGLDTALRNRDQSRVDDWLEYGSRLRRIAVQEMFPAEVTHLFDLKPYVTEQTKRVDQIAGCEKRLRAVKVETAVALQALQARYAAEATLSTAKLLFGGALFFGSDDDGDHKAGRDLALAGGDDLLAAGLRKVRDESRVEGLEILFESSARDEIARLDADYREARSRLADRLNACWAKTDVDRHAVRRLDELSVQLVRAKDLGAAAELLAARIKYLNGKGILDVSAHCTWIELEAARLSMPAPSEDQKKKRVDEIMRLATDTVAAASRLPGEQEFDPDRAALLSVAGKLVHRAVSYSHGPPNASGPRRWSEFYDPRADYGVRVTDLALGFVGKAGDRDGTIRATRAWLLFQRGLFDMAFEQGQEIEKLREDDPVTQFNLARLYAQMEKTREASQRFLQAVRVGYADLDAAAADGDLGFLLRQKYWEDYKRPKLSVLMATTKYRAAAPIPEYSLEIKNTGQLPIVHATLSFGRNVKKPLGTTRLDYLAPGKTFYWVDAVKSNGQGLVRCSLWVDPNLRGVSARSVPVQLGTLSPFGW